MNESTWKRTVFVGILIVAPFAYNLFMEFWASLYFQHLNVTTGSSKLIAILKLSLASLIGITLLASFSVYLLSIFYPFSVLSRAILVALAIVLVNAAIYIHYSAFGLSGASAYLIIIEWSEILLIFILLGFAVQKLKGVRNA
ncbi:hypothetical protein [Methylophaga sp. OBS4]|uniref:hypothetical protein n=1 Tax=Methylophaga sp. OBS4 TaxID=2991935 RepID=UPI0022505633|nr:hypothetical protein [Methylophaga sp. OBS4]MCX4187831.1 hypothetical protein [Methylophaga sp. OBS4]